MLNRVVEFDKRNFLFQVLFLKETEDRSVEVEEAEELNLDEIRKRVEEGESVFITRKLKHEINPSAVAEDIERRVSKRKAIEPWYFAHM